VRKEEESINIASWRLMGDVMHPRGREWHT
jgi:hypothetical protein